MKLELIRTHIVDQWTLGELLIDGQFECFTCEDEVRPDGFKVSGETAIPFGTYAIKMQFSPTYKQIMPYLQDVAGFIGIMIHWGNSHKDTRGCIIVGRKRDTAYGTVSDSRDYFKGIFFHKIQRACAKGDVTITIRRENE